MGGLKGYPTICIKVEVSIDGADPGIATCIEDRGIVDVFPGRKNYARLMTVRAEQMMPEVVREAMRNAGLRGSNG